MENLKKNLNIKIVNFIFATFIFFWDQNILSIDIRFLIILLIPLYFFVEENKNFKIRIKELYIFIFLNLFVFVHFFLNDLFLNGYFYKNLNALIGFFLISVITFLFKNYFIENLESIIKQFILIFFIYFLIELIFFKEFYSLNNFDCLNAWLNVKNTDFNLFTESSHFGMMAPAVVTFILFKNKNSLSENFLSYLVIIFLFLFLSTTFLIGLIISLLFISLTSLKRIKNSKKLLLIFMILFSFIVVMSNKQCNMRFNETLGISLINLKSFFYKNKDIKKEYTNSLENGSLNISSEVFSNSIMIATKSFKSNPLGLGVNNYYQAHKKYSEQFLSGSHFLNKEDASNNLSKIIVEFGVFSLVFFFFLVKFSISNSIDLPNKSFLISIIITQLIRGAGYFNGGFLLCILIIFLYSLNEENA